MRVILADDHSVVRYGMRAVIESNDMGRVVGEAESVEGLIRVLRETPCDVVVADLSMPSSSECDGLVLVERLRRLFPGIPVVVLTEIRNHGVVNMLIARGVAGIVDKSGSLHDLVLALRAVSRDQRFISPEIRSLLRDAEIPDSQLGRDVELTRSEFEVVRLYANDGLTISEIAKRLNRSPKTVSKHKRSAQHKLGLLTNQQLISFYRGNASVA
ncbi:DNA-binding response regulator [Pandoraea fibrosis]|uniref:DNA-binding response regulator n=2 Tax=Pandoraea fibrosis TaxID=1891094 RepID=A0A5E4R8K8_9BURK|nr:DNA-binding response regulator [Pandoraea fibrosis]